MWRTRRTGQATRQPEQPGKARCSPGGFAWPWQPGRARPKQPGFTLLEILVALSVLSITLMTMYQVFSSSLYVQTATRGLWKAMVYANGEMARWQRGSVPQISVQQGSFPQDHAMAGYDYLREVADDEPFPGVKVRKVMLTLTWDAAGTPQRYKAESYVPP